MVSHPPTRFDGHRCCDGGDIKFLVVEEQHSACSPLNLLLLFISIAHGLKVHSIKR